MNDKEQSTITTTIKAEHQTEQGEARGVEVSGGENPKKNNEIGGPKGLEPTRYGDWENNGRCWDF